MSKPGRTAERSVALFLLAATAFSPLMLSVFSADARIAGVPLLYAYLFAAWGGVILLVAWIAERSDGSEGSRSAPVDGNRN